VILVKKEIDYVQAILGDTIEIPVVDLNSKTGIGKANLKIPEGTQYGAKFLMRGKGMPKLKAKGQGDVIVQVYMITPKKISKEQRELLEKYRQSKY
jgi:molecular chaperone DnaJ